MNRGKVAHYLLEQMGGTTYLEIGVKHGSCFRPMIAKRKIGVDPIDPPAVLKEYLSQHPQVLYYQTPSDEFFAQYFHLFKVQKIDVALVDGLHTYTQAIKDVENSLKHLSENGVIVVHDCCPLTESAAAPGTSPKAADGLPGWIEGTWNGDVWKTILYLRSYCDDINVFVLHCDYGLGIITKGKPENMLNLSLGEIEKMTFHDLERDRKKLLNLKDPYYFFEFVKTRPFPIPAKQPKKAVSRPIALSHR
jgi:hypothetical protein